jgi:chorismate synthase
MGNSLGQSFVITSFGESHGRCIGVVIDGCPAGLDITDEDIQIDLDRRRPVEGAGSTARIEEDKVEVLSGVFHDKSTGAPICLLVWNKDVDSSGYEEIRFTPRPGHADYTAYVKYGGLNDYRGGGRFSGRITAGFVMAGAVAKKLLAKIGIEILAHTTEIGGIHINQVHIDNIRRDISNNPFMCADERTVPLMTNAIEKARKAGDSLGGIVECIALNMPVGLGEPVFDTLEGDLAKAIFAIPAVKGIEFGSGFIGAKNKGSENNDPLVINDNRVVTVTNNAGGILGGISSGMPLVIRVAVKPTPSIPTRQQTVDIKKMKNAYIRIKGRHDTCIVPRVVPVIEAMTAVTLADFAIRVGIIPRIIK